MIGPPEPSTPASEWGSLVHEQLEAYLKDPACLPADPRARQAALDNLSLLPIGTVEGEYRLPIPGTGHDFLCRIDWHNADRVLDHKTKGSFDWIPSQYQLGFDVQLLLYAHAVQATHGIKVRSVGHHYIASRGPHRAYVEWAEVHQDRVASTWEEACEDFREMIADKSRPIEAVERNTRACMSWGRPCPYMVECDGKTDW